MKLKNILMGTAIVGTGITGYNIGKVVAYIRSIKYGLNFMNDIYPGFSKVAAKSFSEIIIDFIFDEKETESQ